MHLVELFFYQRKLGTSPEKTAFNIIESGHLCSAVVRRAFSAGQSSTSACNEFVTLAISALTKITSSPLLLRRLTLLYYRIDLPPRFSSIGMGPLFNLLTLVFPIGSTLASRAHSYLALPKMLPPHSTLVSLRPILR